MAGEFGGWTPIGAVQTASRYDVAWKMTGVDEYTVWVTDSIGNYTSNVIGAVSGTGSALETLEPTFNQDLNGDGRRRIALEEGAHYILPGRHPALKILDCLLFTLLAEDFPGAIDSISDSATPRKL